MKNDLPVHALSIYFLIFMHNLQSNKYLLIIQNVLFKYFIKRRMQITQILNSLRIFVVLVLKVFF